MEMLEYILPLFALIVFLLPKRSICYYAAFFVLVYSLPAICGILRALFSVTVPLEIKFTPLASVFALSVVLVGLSVAVYMCGYLKEYLPKKSRIETAFHYLCFILLYVSMLGVLSSVEKFKFLFSWELMSLSSFALVLWNGEGNRKALHAALGYLILMHLGFFMLFFGFYLLPVGQGLMGYGSMPLFVWILFFLGFGIKVGIFPLHGWLPVTHPAAPSHVSAMMSAAMLNMGIYGIFRATLGASDVLVTGIIMFVIGAVTAIFGAYRSSMETNLKTLLAYSSMDNMGIILLAIGLGAIGKAMGSSVLAYCGYCGALIHMLCHSSFKMSLFMGAGAIQQSSGTLSLNSLGGLMSKMPRTGFYFLVASLSAMSIPPLSGFSGEFVILGGIFTSLHDSEIIIFSLLGLVIIATVVGMTVTAMTKAFSRSMLSTPRTILPKTPHESDKWMLFALLFSFVFIVAGFLVFPTLVLSRSSVVCAVADPTSSSMFMKSFLYVFLLSLAVLIISVILYTFKMKKGFRYEQTWSCGAADIPPITQFGASSFSAAISSEVMSEKDVLQNESPNTGLFADIDIRNHKFRDPVSNDLTRVLAWFMHFLSIKLSFIQTGKVNHYVFHALLFIAAILLLSLIGLM